MSQHQPYPPQQPQQPQQFQQFQPLPPKKKHTGLKITGGIIGAFVVIGLIAGATGGSDGDADSKPAAVTSATPSPKAEPAAKDDPEPEKSKKPAAPKAPKGYGDGDYVVGQDIPAGTYESAGASNELLDVCAITTDPPGETTMPQVKSANKGERIIITLKSKDGTVTVQGCEPLKKR